MIMKNIRIISTCKKEGMYWEETTRETTEPTGEMRLIKVYPKEQDMTVEGFGGAFTEAAAHTYACLGQKAKENAMHDLFGEAGLRYTMGRIHMNSCDFALDNYTYIEENDTDLSTFDISHDEKEIIPMIVDATWEAGLQPTLFMTPWSPSPFMKTNGEMNHGGKIKDEYKDLWASYYVRFIDEYRKKGIDISYLSVQNEPNAVQTWDSCIYTAEEEADFVAGHLGPALEEAGLLDSMKLFVWDHNKEIAYDRLKAILNYPGASKYVSGCAVHWYTGDHFENLDLIRKHFPGREIFFTEGCVEYSRFSQTDDVAKAEMYGHQMAGNLNHGVSAIIDWNLLVDFQGGPNHVGNYCDAPLKANEAGDDYERQLSFYYIGHFSRYIKPGAKHVITSRFTDSIDAASFVNPDGERVVVLMNRSDGAETFYLAEGDCSFELTLDPHSISTVLYD